MVSEFWLEAFLTSYCHFVIFFGQSSLFAYIWLWASWWGQFLVLSHLYIYRKDDFTKKIDPTKMRKNSASIQSRLNRFFHPHIATITPKTGRCIEFFDYYFVHIFCPENLLMLKKTAWELSTSSSNQINFSESSQDTIFPPFLLEPLYKIASHFK